MPRKPKSGWAIAVAAATIVLSPVAASADSLSFNWDSAALGGDGWGTWVSSGGDPGGYIKSSQTVSIAASSTGGAEAGWRYDLPLGTALDAGNADQPISFDLQYSYSATGSVALTNFATTFYFETPTDGYFVYFDIWGGPPPTPGTQTSWTPVQFTLAQAWPDITDCAFSGGCTDVSLSDFQSMLPSLLPEVTDIQFILGWYVNGGASGGNYTVSASMDNFSWTDPVPEPSALTLFCAGLGVLGAAKAVTGRARGR